MGERFDWFISSELLWIVVMAVLRNPGSGIVDVGLGQNSEDSIYSPHQGWTEFILHQTRLVAK